MPSLTAAMAAAGRSLTEPRLDPAGERLAFLVTEGGSARIVVVDLADGVEVTISTAPAPIPSRSYGGGAFDWLPDGSAIVYAGVDGGLWRQGAGGGPPRRLPTGDRGPVACPAVSPDGTRVAYVIDTATIAVTSTDPDGPWPVRLSGTTDFALDPAWSPDGRTVAWHEWDVPHMPWDESRIVVRDADGAGEPKAVGGGPGTSVAQPRWSPDGTLGFVDDASGWWNVVAGDVRLDEPSEHAGATWGPGERTWCWSPDGTAVAYTRNEDGFGALHVRDLRTGDDRRLGRAVHGALSWRGTRLASLRSGGVTPTTIVVYDVDSGDRRVVARGPVAGVEAALVEPEVVRWTAPDGAEIPGRLYRPATSDHGGLLCWVHGGPTDQWRVEYRSRLAYFLDRGWTLLVPDHRGSTGHGRAFRQALHGRWGELDVGDTAAGLRAAAEEGWGDPNRFVVMGGSAGGFTVLNLLAAEPELCAAGVDLFGVADLFLLDETTHRYEAHYLRSIVGPLPDAADRFAERSPVNRAGAITAPLLILQGDADEVVPLAQSQAIADELRALGRVVELHVYPGEGHGWGRPSTVMDELERTESFLRRHVLQARAASRSGEQARAASRSGEQARAASQSGEPARAASPSGEQARAASPSGEHARAASPSDKDAH